MFTKLGKPPAYLLSDTEIPPIPNSGGNLSGLRYWHSLDSERNYRKNPHPNFGLKDIEYHFNSHGYRCPELKSIDDQPADVVNVACIGSSGLFGTGLPEEMTLPILLQQMLQDHLGRPVRSWNFGAGGTGPDYLTRMLFSVLPVIKPEIVILTTHPFNRREFMGESGRIYTTQSHPHWQHRFTDPERWQMHVACQRISNPHNHVMNFITNAKVWESLCDDAGAMWLFTSEGIAEQTEPVNNLMREPRKMVAPGMFDLIRMYRDEPETGLARDMLHSGIRPTREHAEVLFARLVELYADELGKSKHPEQTSVQS